MKTILLSLCSFAILLFFFLLFSRLLRRSRRKTSLYKHKSELEATPQSYAMKEHKDQKPPPDISWEDAN